MTVVDTPGAQNPELAGQSRGATFEELCHNYTQERLQLLFHQRTFARELERYKEVTGTPRAAIASSPPALPSPLCASISYNVPPVSYPTVALDWVQLEAALTRCSVQQEFPQGTGGVFAGSSGPSQAALPADVPGWEVVGWLWVVVVVVGKITAAAPSRP